MGKTPVSKITLTILDGNAVDPGDLGEAGYARFNKYADVTVYKRTPPDEAASRIGNSDAVLLNKINITKEILAKCPALKYIGVMATGYNVVDTQAARAAGVTVTNIPAYSTDSVAQHVFAFILHFTNAVALHSEGVMAGKWAKCPDFCYWEKPLMELGGKVLGIYGYGSIGRKVALIGAAFGMRVIVTPHKMPKDGKVEGGYEAVEANELFKQSDFITLHAPLTDETRHIAGDKTIALMKKSAYLINAARGPLVDEAAVRRALDEGRIAGYACDVVAEEPMRADSPLLGAPNCVITPHVAWAPRETRLRLLDIAEQNLSCYLAGKPQNTV